MNFKDATARLTAAVSLADLARETGLSHQKIRQARLSEDATGYRAPPAPEKWRPAVAKLARERAAELLRLADEADGAPST